MTRDEFVKKYQIGDKIISHHWGSKDFLELLYLGDEKFFARRNNGGECSWGYNECAWIPYIESKKKVKMSQAVYNYKTRDETIAIFLLSNSLYKSKEEAIAVIGQDAQWPLVVNGVEQWVEVEE